MMRKTTEKDKKYSDRDKAMMAMVRGSRKMRPPSQAKPSSFSEFWKKTQ